MTDLPAVRDLRSAIEAQQYEDLSSICDARHLREKMQAAADVAKRAGADEMEYRRLAREAERALGRMIISARAAGDLASEGRQPTHTVGKSYQTLPDLDIDYRLASDAVTFAELPDDVWSTAIEDGPARSSLANAARRWHERQRQAAEDAAEREGRLKTEQNRIAAELDRLQAAAADPLPPLTATETSIDGSGAELLNLAPAPVAQSATDDRPEAQRHRSMINKISGLAQQIDEHDPVVTTDQAKFLDLYSARDSVSRLVNAATVWLRTLNALYEDERTQR